MQHTRRWMATIVAVAGCSLFAIDVSDVYRTPDYPQIGTEFAIAVSKGPLMNANTPRDTTKKLIGAVSDGTTVTYAEFRKKVGNQTADLLSWANPQTITRNGNHVILDSAGKATMTSPSGVEVTIAQRVEFDIDPNSKELSISNVQGITVKLSAIAMDLSEAKLTPVANGDTTVSGKLKAARWLPRVPFSITIAPDGSVR